MKKICTGCRRNRRIGKFARDNSRKDCKRIYCRDCISLLNKRYRMSPIGRIKYRESAERWKKNNRDAIREYNKAYYKRMKYIILYNIKCREKTESVIIVDNCVDKPKHKIIHKFRGDIVINPQRKNS